MTTLKEHQAAMVDLLANGSGIPASASRLAHAMHDVLDALLGALVSQAFDEAMQQHRIANDATTPGLNEKALSKPVATLKTDSPAKWPASAESRIKELTNTIRQLRDSNAKLRSEVKTLRITLEFADGVLTEKQFEAEQAGVRKEDTQIWCSECMEAHEPPKC
jgi:hypothetical protein